MIKKPRFLDSLHGSLVSCIVAAALVSLCAAPANGADYLLATPGQGVVRAAIINSAHVGSKINLKQSDRKSLQFGTSAEIIVEFEQEKVVAISKALRNNAGIDHDDSQITAQRAEAYRATKLEAMRDLPSGKVSVVRDFAYLPMSLVRISDEAALNALAKKAHVKAVYSIEGYRYNLQQSLPLISQPAAASRGADGAGVSVAVLDTGVDYTRSAFGSCGAPGGSCKVAVARDFAPDDGVLDADGHGTNVSGIVLGVAPSARIVGLDVFRSDGFAYSDDIIDAINWVIANRSTYNIVSMNMSLGGGRFYSDCPADVFATPLANAKDAGVVTAVASGNDGYKDSISSPACAPAAVSVGAVYDSNLGGISWSNCTDSTTRADKVTCFSNSANFLDLLGPGALIDAAGITQGGTSQATPHVAGALAVLRSAYPSESIDTSIARLKNSGVPVTDTNGLTIPRIDLLNALDETFDSFALIVTKSGFGDGTIASSPLGIDCGAQCIASFPVGSSVQLFAQPDGNSNFDGWSGDCSGTGACVVTMDASRQVEANFSSSAAISFAEALDNGSLAWSTLGDRPWYTVLYPGRDAAVSGDLSHNQSSTLRTSVVGPGNGSFQWQVSSESNYDYLEFRIDGVLVSRISGVVSWTGYDYTIGSGTHELSWVYRKDYSVSSGDDMGAVDAVVFASAATVLPDLSVTDVTAPERAAPGNPIEIALSITNTGSVPSGAFRLGILLSTDNSIDLTDLDTTYYCLFDGLDAGAVGVCSGEIVIPANISSGTYYLGGYADSLAAIAEENENNNGLAADNPMVISSDTVPLSVNLLGSGQGRVTSDPAGIDCGNDCNASVERGTMVRLNATPSAGSAFAGWSLGCEAAGDCTLTMEEATSVDAIFVSEDLAERFPPAARWPAGWMQTLGSTAPWSISNDQAFEGEYSLRAAQVDHNQFSAVEVTATVSAGTIQFARKVSSEASFDFLQFYIDGVLIDQWSGTVAWSTVSYGISAGTHTLQWRYRKDGSIDSAEDTAWIDSLRLPGSIGQTLSVARTGTGGGTVISNPIGLYCGDDCAQPFASAETVSLYAVPDPGSVFLGWNGACDGRDRSCAVLMPGTPVSAEAVFGSGSNSVYSALIEHYYTNILGRVSDASGLAYWLGEIQRLEALGIDLKEAYRVMAGVFLSSAEFQSLGRSDAEFVSILYRTFYDREPDQGGLNYWLSQINQGLSRSVVLFSFLFSPEYTDYLVDLLGNPSSRGEIDAVVDFYRGYLGRLPDESGFIYWLNRFRVAQCTDLTAVQNEVRTMTRLFNDSSEYAQRGRSNAEYVGDLYYAFLRRGGDLEGFLFWYNELLLGRRTRDDLREQFIVSAEFQSRVSSILDEICLQ